MRQIGAQPQLPVDRLRLGEGGVGIGRPALGEERPRDLPVHPRHQRRVADPGCQRERQLGGVRGAGVRPPMSMYGPMTAA
ncbi:hypothetical protein GCM10020254_10220 [Streptomyces goshikiensis]